MSIQISYVYLHFSTNRQPLAAMRDNWRAARMTPNLTKMLCKFLKRALCWSGSDARSKKRYAGPGVAPVRRTAMLVRA